MNDNQILLETINLSKHFVSKSIFKDRRKILKAVDGVDITIKKGETVGLVGESGCGKSTLGRTILKLQEPTSGHISFRGKYIENYDYKQMRQLRKNIQIIFQDPYASLNPRKTIFDSVIAPLNVFHIESVRERHEMVREMLLHVGLGEKQIYKYPHEMSGGQRQRAVIARAIIINPDFVVCDEPVSALDVSVRSQVIKLMKQIQEERKLSYLFISHDLSIVRYLCDTVAVMYLGRIIEIGSKKEIFDHPLHPYTKALMSAIPIPDVNVRMDRVVLEGDVPSPLNLPNGCRFGTRCKYATKECGEREPVLNAVAENHKVACLKAAKYDFNSSS